MTVKAERYLTLTITSRTLYKELYEFRHGFCLIAIVTLNPVIYDTLKGQYEVSPTVEITDMILGFSIFPQKIPEEPLIFGIVPTWFITQY